MTSNRTSKRHGPRRVLSALLATTALLSSIGADVSAQPYAPQGSVREVVADGSGYGGQVALPMGGSQILRFNRPIGRVMLGNPKVGDVIPLGERTLYVLGTAPGTTNLTVMPRGGGEPLATLDLRVGYDVGNIQRAAQQVLPGEPLSVSAHGDGVVLTGVLSSSAAAARAAAIAEQFAPGHVVNLTSVRGAEQVMLSVRVAEVQRSALQQLGLNSLDALWDTTGTFSFARPDLNPDAVLNLLGVDRSGDWTVRALFDALERRGFASTLAEPNLVALSGETAVFFAGGEYPIPVPQTGAGLANTITIEYKQYGVSIGFTPTVTGDSINLVVAPEVSALDPSNAIVLQGYRVPALTARRAKTTVELRNGQSFAIAGLIRREFTDNLRGIPGAARVPVLGALFRSTGYQNNETEVVIIVTARLAKPTTQQALLAPTDVRQGPSEADLFFMGTTDRALPSRPAVAGPKISSSETLPGAGAATAAASKPLASTPLAPPTAMLAVNELVPPVTAPAAAAAPPAPRPTPASVTLPAASPSQPAVPPLAAAPSSTPAPAVVPAPKPAEQPAATAIPAPPQVAPVVAVTALRPAAAATAVPITSGPRPYTELKAEEAAAAAASVAAAKVSGVSTYRPAPQAQPAIPAAKPTAALATARPAIRPTGSPAPVAAATPRPAAARAIPTAQAPIAKTQPTKASAAVVSNASSVKLAAPAAGAAAKPAVTTATKPASGEKTAAVRSTGKVQVASAALRPTPPLDVTTARDATAASVSPR